MTNRPDAELGALLRLVADDEASPAQRADFDARRARLAPASQRELDALLQAERELRAATARAILAHTPPTPADLRARVLDASRRAERPRSPLSRIARAHWAYAAAAAILLVAVSGVLVLSNASWRGTHWTEQSGPTPTLVGFLAAEHSRCSTVGASGPDRKLTARTRDEAIALVARYVPSDPQRVLDAVGPEYRLLGAGPCHVPGGGTSIHVVFVADDPACAPVSVFLQDCANRPPETLPSGAVSLGYCPDGAALRMARVDDRGCLVYIAAPSDDLADAIAARLGAR